MPAAVAKIFDSIADLPANVRERLTTEQQRQWLEVFNSVFQRTIDEGGTEAEADAAAFAAANSVVQMRRGGPVQDFELRVPIEKVDEEKRIVWGWAYVCEKHGVPVIDHSGDIMEAEEVEKAAHAFVLDSRQGGVMHEAEAGVIVDSIFFSQDVQKALGVSLDCVGWFIGMRVQDDAAWELVKSGKLSMFSIGGTAHTEDLTGAA